MDKVIPILEQRCSWYSTDCHFVHDHKLCSEGKRWTSEGIKIVEPPADGYCPWLVLHE